MSGRTPVLAAHVGHGDAVDAVLEARRDVHARSSNGEGNTALHDAAFRGNLEVAQRLAHGAGATLRTDEGHTPLDRARAHGHATVARRLRGELP